MRRQGDAVQPGPQDEWPARVVPGDRIVLGDVEHTVLAIRGPALEVDGPDGAAREVLLLEALARGAQFLPRDGVDETARPLELQVGRQALERARLWERHILEVVTGRRHGPGKAFPPHVRTLAQREEAKAQALTQSGWGSVSAQTVRRKRLRYQQQGLAGLVDGRSAHAQGTGPRVSPLILRELYAIFQRAEKGGQRPSREVLFRALYERVEWDLELGPLMPSRSTVGRIIARAQAAPDPSLPAAWGLPQPRTLEPGDRVVVDCARLLLPGPGDGEGPSARGVSLTVAVDEASGQVLACMLDPHSAPVDPAALLLRLCTPRVLLPGAVLDPDDPQLRTRYIRPRQLVVDDGELWRSGALRKVCRVLGVDLADGSRSTPGIKNRAEARLRALVPALRSALVQYLRGPGREQWARGDYYEAGAAMQAFVDDWLQSHGRPPAKRQEDEPLAVADLPLPPEATLPLLPGLWRQITDRGVQLRGQRYHAPVLDGWRQSPVQGPGDGQAAQGQPGRVRVHYDAGDLGRVWIVLDGQWTPVPRAGQARWVPGDQENLWDGMPGRLHARPLHTAWPIPDADLPGPGDPRPAEAAEGPAGPLGVGATAPGPTRAAGPVTLATPLVADVLRAGTALLQANSLGAGDWSAQQMLLVTGPAGCGKTTAVRELARFVEELDRPRQPGAVPVLYVRVRPAASTRQLLQDTLTALTAQTAGHSTLAGLSDRLRDELRLRRTRLVVFDDAHGLGRAGADRGLSILRHLADQLPTLLVIVASSFDAGPLSARGEQAAARLQHVRGHPVPPGPQWERLIGDLEDQLRQQGHPPGSLAASSHALHRLTEGRPGALAQMVARLAAEAVQGGADSLTAGLERELSAHQAWPNGDGRSSQPT